MNIFVCECLENDFHNMTNTEILVTVLNRSFNSKFIKLHSGDNFFVCCRDMVIFCYKVNRWYFYSRTCSNVMSGMAISCYQTLNYGFRSICKVCVSPLEKKLFPFLIKIR